MTVLRCWHHAPLAAARAARLGAHREAADQLRLALRFHEVPDRRRATLLEQLSYECYLTDQLSQARASELEALAIHEQEQDAVCHRHGRSAGCRGCPGYSGKTRTASAMPRPR